MKKLKKRTLVRIISYGLAAFFVAVGFAVSGYSLACDYRMELEGGYQRALTDLSSNVSTMDTLLRKTQYASTPTMYASLASGIWREASAAKANLNLLPVTESSLDNVNKFLAQVGEYTLSLSMRMAAGEDLTAVERETVATLSSLATEVNSKLNELIAAVSDKSVMLTEVSRKTNGFLAGINNEGIGISGGFEDVENGFEEYPTLIYDGPYSDNLFNRESVMLKSESGVFEEVARQKAAAAFGVSEQEVLSGGEGGGVIPSYYFSCGEKFAEISKAGGYLITMTDGRMLEEEVISYEGALSAAEQFLDKIGYKNMKSTYYMIEYGVCTINFAYEQEGVLCYPDLIKVGVSMSDGSISSFDARGYIMNHRKRDFSALSVSAEEAKKKLSKGLSVEGMRRVVIPTDGGAEKECWELLCKAEDGTQVLEYFEVSTLNETDILILLQSENGALTI